MSVFYFAMPVCRVKTNYIAVTLPFDDHYQADVCRLLVVIVTLFTIGI